MRKSRGDWLRAKAGNTTLAIVALMIEKITDSLPSAPISAMLCVFPKTLISHTVSWP